MRIMAAVGIALLAGVLAAAPAAAQEAPAAPELPNSSEDPGSDQQNWIPVPYVRDIPEYSGEAYLNVDFADFPGAQYVSAAQRLNPTQPCTWQRLGPGGEIMEQHLVTWDQEHLANLEPGDTELVSKNCGGWTLTEPARPDGSTLGAGLVPNPASTIPEGYGNVAMNFSPHPPRGIYASSTRPADGPCSWKTTGLDGDRTIIERHAVRSDRVVVDLTADALWNFKAENCGTWTLLEEPAPPPNASDAAGSLALLFGS